MAKDRIFITGGASGLGLAIAHRYARAGFKVCIGDIHDERGHEAERAIAHSGASEVLYLRCDVRKVEDLEAVADQLDKRWGGVDIVVNNAGVAQGGPFEQVPMEDWEWVLDINLLGVVRGCKVFTPRFKRQGEGYFVNIASMAGLLDTPFMTGYNVSKAGVVMLSETLQNELAHGRAQRHRRQAAEQQQDQRGRHRGPDLRSGEEEEVLRPAAPCRTRHVGAQAPHPARAVLEDDHRRHAPLHRQACVARDEVSTPYDPPRLHASM
jgi:NAD(P)-dependent dehydrogenase (short-subunit alcohol dehydrogenase family)